MERDDETGGGFDELAAGESGAHWASVKQTAWGVGGGCLRRKPLTTHHAFGFQVTLPIGNFLIRFPFSAKIAFATAGAIGGVAGSPTPPCESVEGTMCTSTLGISASRSIR